MGLKFICVFSRMMDSIEHVKDYMYKDIYVKIADMQYETKNYLQAVETYSKALKIEFDIPTFLKKTEVRCIKNDKPIVRHI